MLRFIALLSFSVLLLLAHSARATTTVVLEIVDTDPFSAHELALKLRDDFSTLPLDITVVEIVEQHQPAPVDPIPIDPLSGMPSYPSRHVHQSTWRTSFAWTMFLLTVLLGIGLVLFAIQRFRALPSSQLTAMLILLLVAPSPSLSLQRTYTNCKVLSPTLDYRLYWNVRPGGLLEAAMQAQAQGYVAFGISSTVNPGTLMDSAGSGSDMAIGYMGGDCAGKGCVFDYWSTQHEMPRKDSTQNVTLVHAQRSDQTLAIEFDRPMSTRGAQLDEDLAIPVQGKVMVIYALNKDQVPSDQGNRLAYHGSNRGGILVDFSEPSTCDRQYKNERIVLTLSTPFPSFDAVNYISRLASALKVGAERFVFVSADDPTFSCPNCVLREFIYPNVSITSSMGQTNYLCVDFEFPAEVPFHAIRFDPIINIASSPIVHHMLLFTVPEPSGRGGAWSCEDMPENSVPIFVWAVGGNSFVTPESVGFRVGKGAVTHATLQIHYNNPSLGNWIDSSGVRVYLSPTLRPHNAAWSILGQGLPVIELPPGIAYPSDQLTVSGNCRGEMVDDWTKYGDIHVFAYYMHAHLLGRKIVTHQWRNGEKIAEWSNDPYSFNYQHSVIGEWTIKRGDSFNTTCWYDTTSRTDTTYGGLASTDEMCFALLAFWAPDPTPANWGGMGCIEWPHDHADHSDGGGTRVRRFAHI